MVNARQLLKRARLVLVGAIAVVAACSDAPSAPSAPMSTAMKTVPNASHDVSYQSGSQITVVDRTGHSVTLDASSHEVRLDDGRVYIMSSAQTASVLSDFAGTVSYDQLATELESMPDPPGPPPCGDGSGCEEPTSRVLPTTPILREGGFRRVPNSKASGRARSIYGFNTPRVGHMGRPGGETLKVAPKIGNPLTPNFDYLSLMPDCPSMKRDILIAMGGYRNERDRVTQRWLEAGLAGFVYEAGRWVKNLTLPEANAFFVNLESDMANKAMQQTQLDVMRVAYTSQGCGTISWAGQSGGGGGGGGGQGGGMGGYGMSCSVETWQISFDAGQTWRNIDVSVCEYATQ